jgi:F-type H+-transporting ATPase subunit delta
MKKTLAHVRLAAKYATAFLNVFNDKLSSEDFAKIYAASDFFGRHHNLLFFLTWPSISQDVKIKALYQAFHFFKLDGPYTKLIDMLAHDKRADLIDLVLSEICTQYKKRHGILNFVISSSHQLNEQEIQVLQNFLARSTRRDIIYDYSIDKNLIAGVRMQSDTLLWEHSIRKHLDQIRVAVIR